MAKKRKPITDNMPDKITAHTVRAFRACIWCGGLGHKDHMVNGNTHTKCYKAEYGFQGVLLLPKAERGKFRMQDLSSSECRRLLMQEVTHRKHGNRKSYGLNGARL